MRKTGLSEGLASLYVADSVRKTGLYLRSGFSLRGGLCEKDWLVSGGLASLYVADFVSKTGSYLRSGFSLRGGLCEKDWLVSGI